MHSGTPWVNPTPSRNPPIRAPVSQPYFPSDRERSSPKPQQQKQKGPGGNIKQPKDLPKSPEVKRLESILSGLRSLQVHGPLDEKGRDPKGGCFCKGRNHPLSNYTPICHTCGLPLCTLNLPFYPCPHPPCRTSLLSSTPDSFRVQIQPLMTRIENEIRDQLAKEERERILAAEELRLREGDFPVLKSSPSPSPSPSPASQPSNVRPASTQNQGYTVMSLAAGKGGKRSHIKLASYRPGNISKSSSSSSLKKDAEEDDVVRIRCPPAQVEPIRPP